MGKMDVKICGKVIGTTDTESIRIRPTMGEDYEMLAFFTGEKSDDIEKLAWFLQTNIELLPELLDCVLSEYKDGGSIDECIRLASDEWDV